MKLLLVGEMGVGLDSPSGRHMADLLGLYGPEDVPGAADFKNLVRTQTLRWFACRHPAEWRGGCKQELRETRWSRRVAAAIASELDELDHEINVLWGRRVAAAFGIPPEWPWMDPLQTSDGGLVYVMPHPSGRCRTWNDTLEELTISRALRELL